jgi:hypothetical protein
MPLDRRQLLATSSACLASCASGAIPRAPERTDALDALLDAHRDVLPEAAGAGANHYPMAAEALEALGRADAIEDAWRSGAAGYAGVVPRIAPLADDPAAALGDHARYGDWLDRFRAELARESWRAVVGRWTPRLAPGLSGAALHGLIRTAHATRALRACETDARRDELAVGLAYWAARYTELPVDADVDPHAALDRLEHPWLADSADVEFAAVGARLAARPVAPPAELAPSVAPTGDLDALLRAAATAFLEMLVQERQRIWLLHTVTGPAAVELLLPDVDAADGPGARTLAAHARQAVVALYAAYGAPFVPRAHVRRAPPPWDELVGRAVATRSVHTIKLTEALVRADRDGDPLWRSVAAQWLEWT